MQDKMREKYTQCNDTTFREKVTRNLRDWMTLCWRDGEENVGGEQREEGESVTRKPTGDSAVMEDKKTVWNFLWEAKTD